MTLTADHCREVASLCRFWAMHWKVAYVNCDEPNQRAVFKDGVESADTLADTNDCRALFLDYCERRSLR